MSLPVRPEHHSSSAQNALHPSAMRKPVMNTGAGDMRDAVQRAAMARQSGRGGRVMGGLSVGPTGQAQMPFANAQHSVSGQRGRRAPNINALHSGNTNDAAPTAAQQHERQHQQQLLQQTAQKEHRFLLLYSSRNPDSLYAVQKLADRHRAPHPRVFHFLTSVIDTQRPPNDCFALVRKLQGMSQFRAALEHGCVLFDSGAKRAYDNAEVIDDLLRSHKEALVSRFLDDFFSNDSQQARQRNTGESQQAMPLSSDYDSQRLRTRRGVVNLAEDEPQQSVRAFAKRSVIGGLSMEELEDLAQSANRYVRRDGGGNGGARARAPNVAAMGASGGAGSAQGGTLFDALGNQHGSAEGGAEGSLQQINAKAMRK